MKVKKSEQSVDKIQTSKRRAVFKKGKRLKSKNEVWKTPIFRRPIKLAYKRNPKYLRHCIQKTGIINKYRVI